MKNELLQYLLQYVTPRRRGLFQSIASNRTNHFCVAIEDVGHLHNTSAVIRSCDAFGIQNVHVVEDRYGRRIDREIAMGAQKWTSLHRHNDTLESINHLKKDGYRIVATTPHKKAHRLMDFQIDNPAALFFGSEAKGLSDEVLENADDFIYIPIYGFTESLNISVSAAIIIQELISRLHLSDIPWKLTEIEQEEVQLQWLKKHLKEADKLITQFNES